MTHGKLGIGALVSAVILFAATAPFLLAGAFVPAQIEPDHGTQFAGSGPLDGKTFVGMLGLADGDKDVPDVWVFSKGLFVSKACEQRCKYPARPYFVRFVESKTEFVSETRCPGKDAKLVWRGTVDQGRVQGVMTWTVSRWYWTIEKEFSFSGLLRDSGSPVARK